MNKLLLINKSNYINLVKKYNNFISNNVSNDYQLFILTTAITRPQLHNISFNNYKSVIPKDILIKWIINIDYIKFKENNIAKDELEFTKNNIIEIFQDFNNIDFEFILNEKGNFNKAVRTITDITSKLITNRCKSIFYLEDDWVSKDMINISNHIYSKYDIIRLYFDGDLRNKLSFQPSIIKPHVWYYMFYKKLKDNGNIDKDPEKICQLVFDEINSLNFKYLMTSEFKDIGREQSFNDDNTIRGWYQKTKVNSENISLSYIYIDKLLKSIIYLIDNNQLNENQLMEKISNYLTNIFMKEIINKILIKYKNNKDKFYNYYLKCNKIKNKKKESLKYVYHHIDKLINTGA